MLQVIAIVIIGVLIYLSYRKQNQGKNYKPRNTKRTPKVSKPPPKRVSAADRIRKKKE